jgi:hypothetical protein
MDVSSKTWHCIVFNKEICDVCCEFDMDADDVTMPFGKIKNPRQLCIKAQCPVCFEKNLDKCIFERPGVKVVYRKNGSKI